LANSHCHGGCRSAIHDLRCRPDRSACAGMTGTIRPGVGFNGGWYKALQVGGFGGPTCVVRLSNRQALPQLRAKNGKYAGSAAPGPDESGRQHVGIICLIAPSGNLGRPGLNSVRLGPTRSACGYNPTDSAARLYPLARVFVGRLLLSGLER
jgi:hypothetical protein